MHETSHHQDLTHVLVARMDSGLESLWDHPGSVGELARTVIYWNGYRGISSKVVNQGSKPTNVAGAPAWGFGYRPSTANRYPALVLNYAGHKSDAPSRHAQYVTTYGARTAISLQLSFSETAPLDDKANYARMADNSAVWVWSKVDGKAKAVVRQEPLSTPGGQIELWLSDFAPEDTRLPVEFVRPLHGE